MTRQERRDLRNGILFISPWIIGILAFTLAPLISSLYISFTNYNVLQAPQWAGTQNYSGLFEDQLFYTSLRNTLYFVVVFVPLSTGVSILLAMLLNTKMRLLPLIRVIFYLPVVVPAVATAVLWKWIFDPTNGILNFFLAWFHIQGPTWLGNSVWVKPALILMGLWGVGNAVLMYLASLQDVPESLIEAATVDGAGWWTKTTRIVVPMISPIIFLNVILGVIGGFQYFTQSFIMLNGGGPDNSALFYATYLYQNAFQFFKMGYASAMGWVLFIIILLLTLIIFRSSARLVYYRGEES